MNKRRHRKKSKTYKKKYRSIKKQRKSKLKTRIRSAKKYRNRRKSYRGGSNCKKDQNVQGRGYYSGCVRNCDSNEYSSGWDTCGDWDCPKCKPKKNNSKFSICSSNDQCQSDNCNIVKFGKGYCKEKEIQI